MQWPHHSHRISHIHDDLLAHDLLLDLNEHLMNSVLIHISLSIQMLAKCLVVRDLKVI